MEKSSKLSKDRGSSRSKRRKLSPRRSHGQREQGEDPATNASPRHHEGLKGNNEDEREQLFDMNNGDEEVDEAGVERQEKSLNVDEKEQEHDLGGQEGDKVSDNDGDEEVLTTLSRESDAAMHSDGRYRNKQRCLVLCSRGVTARYRHLLEDLRTLIPHHKKESKLDAGDAGMGRAVNDIAEMKGCNTVLLLECRKHQDAYLWLGRVAGGGGGSTAAMGRGQPGPSVKFHVSNIHTMDELRLIGNCMKGSRPILSFDESFGRLGHLKLLKELFLDVFGTPRGHPKSKPFVDRVMAFYYADKRVSGIAITELCWARQ
jgi:ribosome biogenesis protein BRX1